MERSKAGTEEKKSRLPVTNNSKYNNKHNMELFSKIWKKYNEIQLTKNKISPTGLTLGRLLAWELCSILSRTPT